MDANAMQARLDTFYHEMSAMITDVGVQDVAETDLGEILMILRQRGLWKEENDTTLNAMGTGSKSRAQAFGELSLGNAQIQRILKEFYMGCAKPAAIYPVPVSDTPIPDTPAPNEPGYYREQPPVPKAPVPSILVAAKRGPGRPRRQVSASDE